MVEVRDRQLQPQVEQEPDQLERQQRQREREEGQRNEDDTNHEGGSLRGRRALISRGYAQRDQPQVQKMRPRSDAATDGDRLGRVIRDGEPDQTRGGS
jgi:hypothetical protein